jgi:hypothetical protein
MHHAYGAHYIENILYQEMTPKTHHPPVRLNQEKLNCIRLDENPPWPITTPSSSKGETPHASSRSDQRKLIQLRLKIMAQRLEEAKLPRNSWGQERLQHSRHQ